ncbi:MAG: GNAT family N-acetyltransferase [Bacteroides sp.]|nr:GNAT family N-acetyltransferase [Bacteroides sp.]
MKKEFLKGEKVFLRPVEPEDLETMYAIENDPQMWDISSFTVPYSRYVLRQYIQETQYDIYCNKQLRLMIVERKSGKVTGTVDLSDFSPLHLRAGVGIALLKEYRGQGYGSETLKLLTEYAFEFLHLKQLYAHIACSNKSSIALFTHSGFLVIATLPAWIRDGTEWEDALLVQIINSTEKQGTYDKPE